MMFLPEQISKLNELETLGGNGDGESAAGKLDCCMNKTVIIMN